MRPGQPNVRGAAALTCCLPLVVHLTHTRSLVDGLLIFSALRWFFDFVWRVHPLRTPALKSDTVDANRGFDCLLAELDNPDMGATCKKYVLSFEKLTRKDVNLRPRVVRTCAKDMNRLCSDAGLDVLSCLVDNVAKILNDDCKQLVDEEIALEVCGSDA